MMFSESRIFKNEEVLSPEYLPDFLSHRENKMQLVGKNLKPALLGRKPQNTFIFGSPGIGKTHVTKFIFRELEKESEKIKTIYINCWDYKTATALLSKIAIELGTFVQRRGVSKDEILERLIEALKKSNKNLLICLDEVDQLIRNDQEALYDILRINQYGTKFVGIVFISNDPHIFARVEPRISSSLNVEDVEFKPYNIEEMKDILNERVENALRRVENGVVILCANQAVKKGGDVRIGLDCLLKAARNSELKHKDIVEIEDVKEILKDIKKMKPEILKEKIKPEEKILLQIIKENNKIASGELYEICKIKYNFSERFIRNIVDHLSEIKLIKVKEINEGIRGKTRIFSAT
jgi:archaeal cell division control protein 6